MPHGQDAAHSTPDACCVGARAGACYGLDMSARPTPVFEAAATPLPPVLGYLLRAQGLERDVFYTRLCDALREARWLSDSQPHLPAPVILDQDGSLVQEVQSSADLFCEVLMNPGP